MNAFGILVLIFGCVLAAVLFVAGMVWVGRLASGGTPSGVLDRVQTLELLADVSAEAHAQGVEAQRALEELRELAPDLEREDWQLFEDRYRQTLEDFSAGDSEVQAQMEHLERVFRRDWIIGRARRELRER